jgi:hypothetical protein
MKNYFAALLFFAAPGLASAQTYFQQEVNYKIDVRLNDDKHELNGTEELEYINKSPDQLTYIYFHLWPNAYKNNKTAYARQSVQNGSSKFFFAKTTNRGYIDGLAFEVNGKPAKLEYEQDDIARLLLNEPLKPGASITIRTPFHVKIPQATSRLGHVGQSYQITQWYPKPAVYDRKGWHQMPYLDQGEFFSEFGSFDVKITLPANYNVGATGVLQTATEVARMDSLAAVGAKKSKFGTDMSFPPSSAQTKTLHYVQNQIHDFAWFADKRFNILKSTVELPFSKRQVTTWLLFLNKNAADWLKEKEDINEAIYKYSEMVIEYPYASATAVDGALGENTGGMEYPMVTVTMPSAIIHEVGHNWFYGFLGSNERDYPWMDESMNCYIENRIADEKNQPSGQLSFLLNPSLRKRLGLENVTANGVNYELYNIGNTRGSDQPISLHSRHYTTNNYGGIVYMKAPVTFNYLMEYLGRDRFDKALKAYAAKWQYKHPYPEDMQAVFEEVSGENLSWFFKDLLQTTEPVDIAIKKAEKSQGSMVVTLKNEGKFAAPAPVSAINKQGQVLETQWSKPFQGETTLTFTSPETDRFELDRTYLLPETDRRDNQISISGLWPKQEDLSFQLLAGLEQNRKQQLYFMPIIGANTADKFMLGMAFYNSSAAAKKFNYLVMPMYSFSKNELNGIGHFNFNVVPHSSTIFRQVIFGFTYNRFEYFRKYEPEITFNFKQNFRTTPRQQLKLGVAYINQNSSDLLKNAANPETTVFPLLHMQNGIEIPTQIEIPTVTYSLIKKDAVQNFNLTAQYLYYSMPKLINGGNHAAKAELTYARYWNQKHKFSARLFGGKFFASDDVPGFVMGLSGSPDYARETVFLDRAQKSEGIRAFIDQTDGKDGGFKNYSPLVTDDWLTTLNLETDIPYFPLDAYLDLGRIAGHGKTVYGAGFALNISTFFSLYLPVAGSNFNDTFPDSFKDFRQNIRFNLHLNRFNPFKLLNENL